MQKYFFVSFAVQEIFKKNTTRRVEVFFENPEGLVLAQQM
jgi:hypothetical protein